MTALLDRHAALIYTMVLASTAEGEMSDVELNMMGTIVNTLPIFEDFDRDRIDDIGRECSELLRRADGLDLAIDRIKEALSPPLFETAYALACEVVAADKIANQEELHLLEMLRHELDIDRLVAAGIERGTAARHRVA